jgi:anaphase-promoting complex subunit 8
MGNNFTEFEQFCASISSNKNNFMVSYFLCLGVAELLHSNDSKQVFERYYESLNDAFVRLTREEATTQGIKIEEHHLIYLKGVFSFHQRDYDEAELLFERLFTEFNMSQLDYVVYYSDILFVKENKIRLSHLAQYCINVDKYAPETCCVIGNYYSLRSEHEKAIKHFKRSLSINKEFLSAWTLMGHEYLEMGNSPAAIESYRRALEISQDDYRAWFGLGQVYEMLSLTHYAMYYYQQAIKLRPFDGRLWTSLAYFYENSDRNEDALKAYKRAVALSIQPYASKVEEGNEMLDSLKPIIEKDIMSLQEEEIAPQDATLWFKFAKLYSKIGYKDSAADWFLLCAESGRVRAHLSTEDIVEAYMYLARYYKDKSMFNEAESCVKKLMIVNGKA